MKALRRAFPLLVSLLAPCSLLAQTECELWSPFPEAQVRAALADLACEARLVVTSLEPGLGDRVRAASAEGRRVLLLGHDAYALADAKLRGLLDGEPVYPWCDPWIPLGGSRLDPDAEMPSGIEGIMFAQSWHEEYALPRAEAADALWAGWVAALVRSGRDEEYAFTWLRTLEAHARETTNGDRETLALLDAGRVRIGVVLRSTWLSMPSGQGRSGLREVRFPEPLPRRGHGIAVALGAGTDERAKRWFASFDSPRGRDVLARHFHLQHAGSDFAANVPAVRDVERWLTRWIVDEAGKGKRRLDLENWVDVGFCAVFAVFLFFAYRRLARTEAQR